MPFSSVVFPQPLGPRMQMISSVRTSRVRFSKATTEPLRKLFVAPSMRIFVWFAVMVFLSSPLPQCGIIL